MPSDAFPEPFEPLHAVESAEPSTPPKPLLDRTLPKGVTQDPSVDSEALDPCRTGAVKRQCVAARKAGGRCTAPALTGLVLCSAHAGKLDSTAGGKARAKALRDSKNQAVNRLVEARMGTRAVVASALAEKHDEVRATIHGLADRAADGDRQAALALIPWINQGLGMPGQPLDQGAADGGQVEDLSKLSTAQLKALLIPHQ